MWGLGLWGRGSVCALTQAGALAPDAVLSWVWSTLTGSWVWFIYRVHTSAQDQLLDYDKVTKIKWPHLGHQPPSLARHVFPQQFCTCCLRQFLARLRGLFS